MAQTHIVVRLRFLLPIAQAAGAQDRRTRRSLDEALAQKARIPGDGRGGDKGRAR